MASNSKAIILAAGLVLALAGAGNALADSPVARIYKSSHHQSHHVQHVYRHRPAHKYRYRVPRAGSRGHYRVAPRHVRRVPHRLRPGLHRYPHGVQVYRTRHRHRPGVDAGAVVAGLIVGGLVYELLKGDHHDDAYRYAYYER